jgi:hypothetical protein
MGFPHDDERRPFETPSNPDWGEMNPKEYAEAVYDRLASATFVIEYRTIREQVLSTNAHLRMRVNLIDGSILEFSEYIRLDDNSRLEVVAYSYHWMESNFQLRVRWDNTEHFPSLPAFPHHVHDGDEKHVLPGEPMNLFKVLDEIGDRLRS